MILKNLLRRKVRTLLTVFGVSLGVAAIIGLGALADGFEAGYSHMMAGSNADLVISQPNSLDVSLSNVAESVEPQLRQMPEVAEISGMIQGWAQTQGEPFFFVFGYPEDSFVLSRFHLTAGVSLDSAEARRTRGKPVLLGSAAAEILKKDVGDTLRLSGSAFRVIGIYDTGDAREDSGALMRLRDAQELLNRPRQVSLFYVQLKDPKLEARFTNRAIRTFDGLDVSQVSEFANKQQMQVMLRVFVWVIGGLAIVIGGVGMMNTQLMAVMERTREIGVLRAVGWRNSQVLRLMLGEAVVVCLIGGLAGIALGWGGMVLYSRGATLMGLTGTQVSPALILQALTVVLVLGLVGGLYPAWRASRLQPIEALRYEGGSSGAASRRLPVGGMALQSLFQRSGRTFLTLGTIGLTVGAIIALEAVVNGMVGELGSMLGGDAEIMVRQADVSDTSLSALDERIGEKIAAMPAVHSVDGMIFTAVSLPDTGGFLILQAYPPNSRSLIRFKIVQGTSLTGNHQVIIGRMAAESLNKQPGDTLELSGTRFRVVGVFETGIGWEETGVVMSLRDGQIFAGRPHKAMIYAVKLRDPAQAEAVAAQINRQFDEAYAALSGDFVDAMPDMRSMDVMINGISFLAIAVGGVGVLNTMLMSIFERTREIGVLRALGWRRRRILILILQEALWLGLLGGLTGIAFAFLIVYSLELIPLAGDYITPVWNVRIFARAIGIALALGVIGGIYPAWRATRLQPIEALRYE